MSTVNWFLDKSDAKPKGIEAPYHHHYEEPDVAKVKIRDYLSLLIPGCALPNAWFDDPIQYERLFESLKGHLGANSVCQGNGNCNLRLGAVPLLMAAQMAYRKSDVSWIEHYQWDDLASAKVEIMEHNDANKAKAGVRALIEFLATVAIPENGGANQVVGISWVQVPGGAWKHLCIDLRFNPLDRSRNRSFMAVFQGRDCGVRQGVTAQAYEKMITAAKGPNGRARFVMCFYPIDLPSGETCTRLDFGVFI